MSDSRQIDRGTVSTFPPSSRMAAGFDSSVPRSHKWIDLSSPEEAMQWSVTRASVFMQPIRCFPAKLLPNQPGTSCVSSRQGSSFTGHKGATGLTEVQPGWNPRKEGAGAAKVPPI